MNRATLGKRLIVLKSVCTVMVLVLGAGLFSSAAMGSDDCGMKCCCRSGSTLLQTSSEMQMRSQMGCCSGKSVKPCDLKGAKPVDMPELAVFSWRIKLFSADYATSGSAALDDNCQYTGRKILSPTRVPKFNSPPIYLQKVSFLI